MKRGPWKIIDEMSDEWDRFVHPEDVVYAKRMIAFTTIAMVIVAICFFAS